MFGEVNRIMDAITDMDQRIAGLDPEALARVEASATLDFDEWFAMGDWASRAVMANLVTLDESMTLYHIHGEMPGTFESATLAERVTFMRVMAELGPTLMGRVG